MKQKIKNSCFSKMKRVALALFAALCVGSVWGASRGVFWSKPPQLSVNSSGVITVTDANNFTWDQGNSGLIKEDYNAAVNGLMCEDRLVYTLQTVDGQTIEREIVVMSQYSVSGSYTWNGPTLDGAIFTHQIEEWSLYQVASVSITYKVLLNKSVLSTINYQDLKYRSEFIYSGYDFEMTGVLSTNCALDNSKKCFVVSGNAIADGVKVRYAIGGLDLAASTGLNCLAEGQVSDGNTYRVEIPFGESEGRKLIWSVYANVDGTDMLYTDYTQKSVFDCSRIDTTRVTYTWTGNAGNGLWADESNWSANSSMCYGYPGEFGAGYHYSSVYFDRDADVNLGGGSYCLVDNADSFTIASDKNVILRDGTIDFGKASATLGASGSTLEFNNVNIKRGTSSNGPVLFFADGSTIVLSGTPSPNYWKYAMNGNNVNFIIRDGYIKSRYSSSEVDIKSTQTVLITNAVWEIINGNDQNSALNHDRVNKGLAYVTKFRDGVGEDGRQARFIQNSSGEGIALLYTYDIVIPEDIKGRKATIQANKLDTQNSESLTGSCTFRLDVSNYLKSDRVPLVYLTLAGQDNNMQTKLSNTKLEAIANEIDVTKDRNAKLEWDSSNQTLYYVQDEVVPPAQSVAMIEETEKEYSTLTEAIAAANGDTIKLLSDIEASTAFVIGGESGAKTVTIDLNGKTIATTQADTEGNGVFWVKTDGELTLNGEGTINGVGGNAYNIAIWADGGKVTINGGTYTNEGAQDDGPDGAHFDLIYAKNGGEIVINGGTFKCQTPNWTLNSHDTAKGTIVVKGGTFYLFNPSDCKTEGAGTNWCADNYRVEADGDWYLVKEGDSITVEKPVVIVQTQDAANAVTLNVVPPADLNLTDAEKEAYRGYFEKKITPEGSGFKVELALVNAVKPVIAETTAEDTTKEAFVIDADGNVTLNINNKMPGLYYGVQVLKELGADPEVTVSGLVVPAKDLPEGNAAFFRVVVDFKPIPEVE